MADGMSDRFALPLLHVAQAQKELTHNEALTIIDLLLHPVAESATIATPPSAPLVGQCWIVASGGTGAWTGKDATFACFTSGGWRYISPRKGLRVGVVDTQSVHIYDGLIWTIDPLRTGALYLDDVKVVGPQQPAITGASGGITIDAEARAAINAILEAMRNHGLIATA
jgi:hypothetical protein